ncbi:hypothetical protein BVX98_05835 [bacterium F11]|nr:hypothetical protein BVX98_05835 [bacterium F11]
MRRKKLNVLDEMSLSRLTTPSKNAVWEPSFSEWIRILRGAQRMTQATLAKRAKMSQPHVAGIEAGKIDPQISTINRIFDALSCQLIIEPRPKKPIEELLRVRARIIALKRLKQTMGTMALEDQAPDQEVFKQLLNKYTEEILNDRREQLWEEIND